MSAAITILKAAAPYLKYVLFGATIVILGVLFISKTHQVTKLDAAMESYKRQTAGQLTDAEKKLEAANQDLGLSQSKLLAQSDLLKAFQEEKIKTSAEFESFKKQYKLELDSYQRTVAQLREQIKGGTTTVSIGKPRLPTDPVSNINIDPKKEVITYNWKSTDGRFELDDPDIYVSDNETFKLNQSFRITGEVYREKAGFLKTQRLTVEEVIIDGKNADGSAKYKSIGMAKVVDSQFKYSELAPDTWIPKKGVFGIWPIVSANFGLNIHNGVSPRFLIGTGLEFISFKVFGLGVQAYLDTTMVQDSAFGVHLSYRPTIIGHQLNLAISLGLATEFRAPFQSAVVIGGLNFYLW